MAYIHDPVWEMLAYSVRRIPPSIVNSASIKTVQEYKKLVAEIYKALGNHKSSNAELSQLQRSLQRYFDPEAT